MNCSAMACPSPTEKNVWKDGSGREESGKYVLMDVGLFEELGKI